MTVPEKAVVLRTLEAAHRETTRAFAVMQQRAQVMEARATAAEERLAWMTKMEMPRDISRDTCGAEAGRLQQLLQENERLHAQLAKARLQLSDHDRSEAQLKCRIVELETRLERAGCNSAAHEAQRKQNEDQIKSLRASIRALEKELIQSASGYR